MKKKRFIEMHLIKELGARPVKLALLLINFLRYGHVQYLVYGYLKESPNCVDKYQTFIDNN